MDWLSILTHVAGRDPLNVRLHDAADAMNIAMRRVCHWKGVLMSQTSTPMMFKFYTSPPQSALLLTSAWSPSWALLLPEVVVWLFSNLMSTLLPRARPVAHVSRIKVPSELPAVDHMGEIRLLCQGDGTADAVPCPPRLGRSQLSTARTAYAIAIGRTSFTTCGTSKCHDDSVLLPQLPRCTIEPVVKPTVIPIVTSLQPPILCPSRLTG